MEFVRAYGHDRTDADKAAVIGAFWRQCSRQLQRGNAEMVLSAIGRQGR